MTQILVLRTEQLSCPLFSVKVSPNPDVDKSSSDGCAPCVTRTFTRTIGYRSAALGRGCIFLDKGG